MSDETCTNCDKQGKCPFEAQSEYECIVEEIKLIKKSLSSDETYPLKHALAVLSHLYERSNLEEALIAKNQLEHILNLYNTKLPRNLQ